jgi:WhiB family redox-sensing transcriptional regulator
MELAQRPTWQAMGACRGLDPAVFLPARGDKHQPLLRELCRSCAVPEACAAYALHLEPTPEGLWAGLTVPQRRKLRQRGRLRLDGDAFAYDGTAVRITRGPRPLPDVATARAALVAVLPREKEPAVSAPPAPKPAPPAPSPRDLAHADDLGLTPAELQRLRALVAVRGRAAWEVGDMLVAAYGPASTSGVSDGSRAQLAALADEVGVSTGWMVAARNTAGAWPQPERRPCAWALHAELRSNPDRVAVLDRFIAECKRNDLTPSTPRLVAWIGVHGLRPARPSHDPVAALERRALALPHDALLRLIERLTAALATAAAA